MGEEGGGKDQGVGRGKQPPEGERGAWRTSIVSSSGGGGRDQRGRCREGRSGRGRRTGHVAGKTGFNLLLVHESSSDVWVARRKRERAAPSF